MSFLSYQFLIIKRGRKFRYTLRKYLFQIIANIGNLDVNLGFNYFYNCNIDEG